MDKNIIYEYMDAKALVKETEEDIRRHRRKMFVQDKVTGSNPEFPYQPQSFNISVSYTHLDVYKRQVQSGRGRKG